MQPFQRRLPSKQLTLTTIAGFFQYDSVELMFRECTGGQSCRQFACGHKKQGTASGQKVRYPRFSGVCGKDLPPGEISKHQQKNTTNVSSVYWVRFLFAVARFADGTFCTSGFVVLRPCIRTYVTDV